MLDWSWLLLTALQYIVGRARVDYPFEIIKTLFQKGRKNYGTRRLKNALIGLDRQFTVAQPNQIYVGDIAYIHTWKAGCTWL